MFASNKVQVEQTSSAALTGGIDVNRRWLN